MGRTRVYFRGGALEHLEELRLLERSKKAMVLQAVGRMWPRRVYYCDLKVGALRGQTEWRRVAQRRRYLTDRRRVIMVQVCKTWNTSHLATREEEQNNTSESE